VGHQTEGLDNQGKNKDESCSLGEPGDLPVILRKRPVPHPSAFLADGWDTTNQKQTRRIAAQFLKNFLLNFTNISEKAELAPCLSVE